MNNHSNVSTDPETEYKSRREHFQNQWQDLGRKADEISRLRLLVSLSGAAIAIILFWQGYRTTAFLAFSLTAILFIFLVARHQVWKEKRDFAKVLLSINETCLERLAGRWPRFPDTGSEFADDSHPYSQDLDIFGQNSLFQSMNTTRTYPGREKLKKALTQPLKNADEIRARQSAVQEMAGKLAWRQDLQASGIFTPDELKDPEDLLQWSKTKKPFYRIPLVIIICRALPCLTVLLILGSWLFPSSVSYAMPFLFLVTQAGLLFWRRREMGDSFNIAHQYKESIKTYSRMISLLAEENFSSPYLKELQSGLRNGRGQSAQDQIKKLEKAVDMTYMRFGQLYFLYNILTLWDFQCQIALEAWKERSGRELNKWLQSLGEAECLASIALLAFDHPHWTLPEIKTQGTGFSARELAHPLLIGKMVGNDVAMTRPGEIFLITGSNMSGKSTLLRTAGINLVLAFAGAPVCAGSFSCSLMDIYTSMRINDDLASSTSSFYAELLRIKTILDAAKKKERPLFFLLDEVFRGTNSLDRHTGARHLLKMLSRTGAIGLVSTHDLELGELASEKESRISNFHFREEYRDGELHFDYRLYPGVSTTKNALFLMKMVGIEIE